MQTTTDGGRQTTVWGLTDAMRPNGRPSSAHVAPIKP
jgi:hypothetical protein